MTSDPKIQEALMRRLMYHPIEMERVSTSRQLVRVLRVVELNEELTDVDDHYKDTERVSSDEVLAIV